MKNLFAVFFIVFSCSLCDIKVCAQSPCPTKGKELISNGEFTSGNTGFTTAYNYCNSSGCLYPEGTYAVGNDANFYHDRFFGRDHTTGTGKFMIVNGETTNGITVWSQTIPVIASRLYEFSAWVCAANNLPPAELQFEVNGTRLGMPFKTAKDSVAVWQNFFAQWNSGASTYAVLRIVDLNTVANGNDFGVDDISFKGCCEEVVANGGADAGICAGDSVTLTAMGGVRYQWSTGDSTATIRVRPSSTTVYTVTAFEELGCSARDSVTVTVNPIPIATAKPNAVLCFGDSIQLEAGGGVSYSWTPTIGLSNPTVANTIAHPTSTTTYVVKVTSASGCSDTASLTITVIPLQSYDVTPQAVDLGIGNLNTPKSGKIVFTNNNVSKARLATAYFYNATFEATIAGPSFPLTVSENGQSEIEFTVTPRVEGVSTGEICVEVDSACPAKMCIPVKIEAVPFCVKPDVSDVAKKKPGQQLRIPIILDPSTKFKTATTIDVTLTYTNTLLRLDGDPIPVNTTISGIIRGDGSLHFTATPNGALDTPTATIAELSMTALLAPFVNGTIDVMTSVITLQSGDDVTGKNCPSGFTLDSSCVMPHELRTKANSHITGIYPNPASGDVTLAITIARESMTRIEILDVFGNVIARVKNGVMAEGSHELTIPTATLATGLYFCHVECGNILTRAFAVMK